MSQITEWHCLLWYDGPHIEIRGTRETPDDTNPIVEVRQWLSEIEGEPNHEHPRRGTMRLTREDLQAMLDLLDGKPVLDEPRAREPIVATWKEDDETKDG